MAVPSHSIGISADHACLLAALAWGGGMAPTDWDRLSPSLRERMLPDWEFLVESGMTPSAAETHLAQALRAQRRVDLSRVHPSWIIRALQEESEPVRRLIAARGPEPVARLARDAFGLDGSLESEPDPDAAELALTLWAERLVGDQATSITDPPVVVALTLLSRTELLRLVETMGWVKLRLLPPQARPEGKPRQASRSAFAENRSPGKNARVEALIATDLEGLVGPKHRAAIGLGFQSLARLSTAIDPYRLRWAMQHLPYPVARRLRAEMSQPLARNASLVAWETRVLRVAIQCLNDRGRCPANLRGLA